MSILNSEMNQALREVSKMLSCYGTACLLYDGDESSIERDDYGNIISYGQGSTELNCQFIPNPTDKQLEKAGIRETCDGIIYLATFDCNAAGYSYEDEFNPDKTPLYKAIDAIRQIVQFQGTVYKITSRNRVSQFGSKFLYITLGVIRN
ncbi:hypothetical protein EHQ53_14030 [Leptospira langatensis]|uniref:Uncharacterized protein n=1 Tax=Leptospira langatensis TaxID=2484983 RepID=A0ABY2MDF7_9LEPT|nr:hypothetical protein [Leptospira langatensis]TGL39636.1 hypothetical protein EHQ53_14030 [Leptospira langatensis]